MKRLLYLFLHLSIVFVLLTFSKETYSQYYSSGQDPASVQWNQINSSHFQVIYPVGYDSVAQYVMNVMEYGRFLTLKTYEVEPGKISVILHNQTVVSNAEVAWAPRRMEFYSIPPQTTYSQAWYEQLAIHEYTHVLQISSMERGLTKLLYGFFGEQITVGIFGLYVPFWFTEGDAVVSETALSHSGRGRDPGFEAELRAQLLEKGMYSLEKATLGSYKDFTPDRYHLGYYLVGQGKATYGKDMWQTPLYITGSIPFLIVPFSSGIEKATGFRKNAFYKHTLSQLTEIWLQQLLSTRLQYNKTLTSQKGYVDYSFNTFISDDKILSLKKDYHDIGRIVVMDTTGKEEEIFTPGYYFTDAISVAGDWVCWAEYQFDPRWDYRTYAKILMMNIKTGDKKTLLRKSRYFSPALSPSATQIAVSEVDEFGKNRLVIIDAQDGHVLQSFQTENNGFIAHPSWSQKEDKLVAEVLNETGKAIVVFNVKNGHINQITKYANDHILYPKFWENYIVFEASYSGVMDVYAIDIRTKSIYKTTSSPFSASDFSISPDGKKLVFSNYTGKGKQVVMKTWDSKLWTPFSQVENHAYPLADILSAQLDTTLNPKFIPQEKYEVKKYSKFGHLLNIHSWSLVNFDAQYGTFNPGVVLLTQNKLSTLSARIGADYNINTGKMRYYTKVDYFGWYPVISLGANRGSRFIDEDISGNIYRHNYMENNFNISVYVPLKYVSGIWSFNVKPVVELNFKKISPQQDLHFEYTDIKSLNYSIQFSGFQKSSFQNLFPSWGYSLNMGFRTTPFKSTTGEMFYFGIATYLHGLFRHDGFRLMYSYQQKSENAEFYSDYSAPARGYSGIYYKDLFTFRSDYQVPISYPDFNIGSIIYLKRIVLGVFYDYSQMPDMNHLSSDYWSSGVELTTDVHFLRTKLPIRLGVRFTYRDGYSGNERGTYGELIYSLSL